MSWRRRQRRVVGAALLLALVGGCGRTAAPEEVMAGRPSTTALRAEPSTTTVPTTAAPSTTPPTTATPPTTTPPTTAARQSTTSLRPPAIQATAPAPDPATTAPPAPGPLTTFRRVHDQAWVPFATVGGVVLHHPSARVERVGFHESNHDGARQLEPLPTAVDPVTLETRQRGTGSRTAADVVADPHTEIRAPVTGRVVRAGTYVLYCDHSDDYAVIEPDAHPGWEVKVLHIDGVSVHAGDRVQAGETVVARHPTPLPFESQVDEVTARPPWPHVHIEVVDPSIPDRPSGGGC